MPLNFGGRKRSGAFTLLFECCCARIASEVVYLDIAWARICDRGQVRSRARSECGRPCVQIPVDPLLLSVDGVPQERGLFLEFASISEALRGTSQAQACWHHFETNDQRPPELRSVGWPRQHLARACDRLATLACTNPTLEWGRDSRPCTCTRT